MALVLVLLLGRVLALLMALALALALALVLAPAMIDLSWRDDYSTVRFASLSVSVPPPRVPDAAAVGCGGGDCPDDDAPGVGSGDVSSFFVRRLFVEVPCVLVSFVPPRCPWRLLPATVPALAMVMVLALWALVSALWVGTT